MSHRRVVGCFVCSAAAAVCLAPVLGQVEVVYAIESHAPADSPKSHADGLGWSIRYRDFPRAFRAPGPSRWVVIATVNTDASQDQVLVTGAGLYGVVQTQEATVMDSSNQQYSFGTSVSPRVTDFGNWVTTVNNGDRVIRSGNGAIPLVVYRSSTAWSGVPGSAFAANAFSSANWTAGGISCLATLSANPSGWTKVGLLGSSVLLRVPADVPGGQSGGTGFPIADVDANGFHVSESGTHWMARGRIAHTSASADRVLVVDGVVRIQEGTALPGVTSPVATIVDSFMESNGDWFARGSNANGGGWMVKNGEIIARVGGAVVPGSGEQWAVLLDVHGNTRGDYVIAGRTNNEETGLSDVLVVNGRHIVARESDGVDLDNDGECDDGLFLHILQDRVMFHDDGYVYFSSRLKATAGGTIDVAGVNGSSFLRVPGCLGDIGQAGGVAGHDRVLDNNDFVVFIAYFFESDGRADRGGMGGVAVPDGAFDNNDFIVFINQFFDGC